LRLDLRAHKTIRRSVQIDRDQGEGGDDEDSRDGVYGLGLIMSNCQKKYFCQFMNCEYSGRNWSRDFWFWHFEYKMENWPEDLPQATDSQLQASLKSLHSHLNDFSSLLLL
jgi:hypothetical protein